jgi:hypothetical protein
MSILYFGRFVISSFLIVELVDTQYLLHYKGGERQNRHLSSSQLPHPSSVTYHVDRNFGMVDGVELLSTVHCRTENVYVGTRLRILADPSLQSNRMRIFLGGQIPFPEEKSSTQGPPADEVVSVSTNIPALDYFALGCLA